MERWIALKQEIKTQDFLFEEAEFQWDRLDLMALTKTLVNEGEAIIPNGAPMFLAFGKRGDMSESDHNFSAAAGFGESTLDHVIT